MSGAAMSVGVGSVDEKIQGMAHFVEHMSFFNSEKYPEEGYFMEIVHFNGGYTNAYTADEETNFYYSISNDEFEQSLDVFAQFFINPVFQEDQVQREIFAVNSEHQKNIYSDTWRAQRLLQLMATDDYGTSHFSTGSIETLDIEGIRQKTINFWEKYYIGENMKLVIYTKEDFDKAKKLVQGMFENVRKGQKYQRKDVIPFASAGKILYSYSMSGDDYVMQFIPITSQFKYIESYPAEFICYLLNNLGPNGLYAQLVDDITGLYPQIFLNRQNVSVLAIFISLQDNKLGQVDKILHYIQEYLNLIKIKGAKELEELWQGYQKVQELENFNNQGESVLPTVYNTASNMHNFPYYRYIEGFDKRGFFNYKDLIDITDQLSLKNSYILVLSQQIEQGFIVNGVPLKLDQYDHFYDINYEVRDYINTYNQTAPQLDLQEPNPYIPNHMKTIKFDESQTPNLLYQNESNQVWYLGQVVKEKPICAFSVKLNIQASQALLLLHSSNVENFNIEQLYQFDEAGFTSEINADFNSIELFVGGWSEGIELYFQQVIKYLAIPSEKYFYLTKQEIVNELATFDNETSLQQGQYYLNRLIMNKAKLPGELLKELNEVSYATYKQQIQQLFDNCKLTGFFHGNLEELKANEIALNSINQFKCSYEENIEGPKQFKLQDSQVFAVNSNDSNHALIQFIDIGAKDQKRAQILHILSPFIYNQAFEVLRTQNQLGYIVLARVYNHLDGLGYLIEVQGPYKTPKEMITIVNQFWQGLKLTEENFQVLKESYLENLKSPKDSVLIYHNQMWEKIKRSTLNSTPQDIAYQDALSLLDELKQLKKVLNIAIYKEGEQIDISSIDIDYYRRLNNYY